MDWKANPAFAASRRTDALVQFRAPDGKKLERIAVPDAALQKSARQAIKAGELAPIKAVM